jgi:hypothetical protein
VLPGTDPGSPLRESDVTERLLRWLDMLGLDPATIGDSLVLSPTCGLAGASQSWARQALALLRGSARHLTG